MISMVEPNVIVRILTLLDEYLRDLEEIRQTKKLQDFLTDKVTRRYSERTLQIAMEACLDIAGHIISYEGLREPVDNKDCFQVLYETGIVPNDLSERLKKMAQFRNVVVHDYLRINPEIIFSIVQRNLPDIASFAAIIKRKYIDSKDDIK